MKLETLKRIAAATGGSVKDVLLTFLLKNVSGFDKEKPGFYNHKQFSFFNCDLNVVAFYCGFIDEKSNPNDDSATLIVWEDFESIDQVEQRFNETIQLLSDFAEFNFPPR